MRMVIPVFVLLCGLFVRTACADEIPDFVVVPLPEGLVAPAAKVTDAALVCFFEGPAVDAQDNLYFSDIMSARTIRQPGKGAVDVGVAHSARPTATRITE